MKKIITGVCAIIIAIGAFYAMKIYTQSYENNSKGLVEDNKVKDDTHNRENDIGEVDYNEITNFSLVDLDGNEIALSDYEGKKVFINFWATWCPPCRGEMPDMNKLHSEIQDSDVTILAVNVGEDKELVEKFIKNNNFNFKVLLDMDTRVSARYGISAFPTSVLIDEKGEVVKAVRGAMTYEQMKEFIK